VHCHILLKTLIQAPGQHKFALAMHGLQSSDHVNDGTLMQICQVNLIGVLQGQHGVR